MKVAKLIRLTKNKFLNHFKAIYLNKNGKESEYFFASRKENPTKKDNKVSDAIMIVATVKTEEGNKLVVTKEKRIPVGVADGNFVEYSFPAGLLEEGETCANASFRELKEETGLDAIESYLQTPSLYSTSGVTDETITFVFVKAKGEISNEGQEEDEDIEVKLMSQSEVANLLNNYNIKFGAKSWPLLWHFAKYGTFK